MFTPFTVLLFVSAMWVVHNKLHIINDIFHSLCIFIYVLYINDKSYMRIAVGGKHRSYARRYDTAQS